MEPRRHLSGLQRKWQALEWAVVGRERPIRHIHDLPNEALGLRRPDGQLPPVGAQFEPDPFGFGADLLKKNDPDYRTRLPTGKDVSDPIRSPGAVLIDTVAHLQLDMKELRSEFMCN